MDSKRIVFIGGGNMATALLAGLTPSENAEPASVGARTASSSVRFDLRVADPSEDQRAHLESLTGVTAFANNLEAIEGADCVVFAVKPQIMRNVCAGLTDAIKSSQPLLVSVAAGIDCKAISRWFDDYHRIVRVMPNTPALLGAGASGLFADSGTTKADKKLVDEMFTAVGLTAWVDHEAQIDAVTALSGSGPAYFFFMLEAMEDTGVAQGLPRELAQKLARQTALGAARMALAEPGTLNEVRRRVTSPGGTTAAAIEVLAAQQLPTIIGTAMAAARDRAGTLAEEFGADEIK